MEPGTIQIGFVFHDPRPLCTKCGVRSAMPDPRIPGAYFAYCARCTRQARRGRRTTAGRRAQRRTACAWCQQPRAAWAHPERHVTCSPLCRRHARAHQMGRDKAWILDRLGNRCTCAGCSWHADACHVRDLDVLEIDHTQGNGATVRKTRMDGTRRRTDTKNRWGLYRREIETHPTTHGLQLLCANCHRAVTVARRQPLDPP